jgi:hypothetical protein
MEIEDKDWTHSRAVDQLISDEHNAGHLAIPESSACLV